MNKLVKIGVNMVEGCTLKGGEFAMQALEPEVQFDVRLDTLHSLHRDQRPLFLDTVVDLNQRLKLAVQDAQATSAFTVVFGGDHALSIGSIAGLNQPNLSVLWIDAHGDCNTPESSITQRIHGMPLATLLHHGHKELVALVDEPLKPLNILQIGIRDLDAQEEAQMQAWGVRYLTMEHIRTQGIAWMMQEVLAFADQAKQLHISFDCDSMEPTRYPGVNTDVPGGFHLEELEPLFKALLPSSKLQSMDIVEFNPVRDRGATKQLILTLNQWLEAARVKP